MRSKIVLGLVALLFVALMTPATASDAGRREPNSCLNDAGVDYNVLFGVSEQIVNRFCLEADAGDHWRPFALWIVNTSNESFPAGYVPAAPTPLEDFVAKLVAVKVVIDGGTRQERTFVESPTESVSTDVTFDQLEPGAPPLPMAATMPRMNPLSVGEHTRELFWVLSAMHCDGLAPNVEENCLPAGEVSHGPRPFTVIAPAPVQ